MQTSRSRNRSAEPPPKRPRFSGSLVIIALLAVAAIVIVALPASLAARFLPESVTAGDFSGSLWHGSAGSLKVGGREAGAIEWRLHPWPLFALTLAADVHWVKTGFLADAALRLDRHALTARNLEGGGPIEDLADLGIAAGWHGITHFNVTEIEIAIPQGAAAQAPSVSSAVGEIDVAGLSSPQIANGADLGGYGLHSAEHAVTPDAGITGELEDTGGPLELHATVQLPTNGHTGVLSGTLRARADAPPALIAQLDTLTQLHARDAQGRIPVDLEFTL